MEAAVFTLVVSPFVAGVPVGRSPVEFLALPLVLLLVGGNAVLLFRRVHRVAQDAVADGVGEGALVTEESEPVDWWAGGEEG